MPQWRLSSHINVICFFCVNCCIVKGMKKKTLRGALQCSATWRTLQVSRACLQTAPLPDAAPRLKPAEVKWTCSHLVVKCLLESFSVNPLAWLFTRRFLLKESWERLMCSAWPSVCVCVWVCVCVFVQTRGNFSDFHTYQSVFGFTQREVWRFFFIQNVPQHFYLSVCLQVNNHMGP